MAYTDLYEIIDFIGYTLVLDKFHSALLRNKNEK